MTKSHWPCVWGIFLTTALAGFGIGLLATMNLPDVADWLLGLALFGIGIVNGQLTAEANRRYQALYGGLAR